MSKVHYTDCPVCKSPSIQPVFRVKDHSVSGEVFAVWECGRCTLRFTQDVPDEASIAPYYQSADYISHSNTSKGLVNRMYQKVRNYTLAQKASLIGQHAKQSGSLLDIGAGIGAFLHVMKKRGWQVQGIEPDAGARAQAQQLFGLTLSDMKALEQLPEASYDAITMWHVLEHVHSLHDDVERLKYLLKPGGVIFIAVPNYTSRDSSIYRQNWAAYDVPRHLYHFTPPSMDMLMKAHGLQIVATKPMWFDAFYISLLSSKYKNGSTQWLAAAFNGLRSNLTALRHHDRCSSLIYIVKDGR